MKDSECETHKRSFHDAATSFQQLFTMNTNHDPRGTAFTITGLDTRAPSSFSSYGSWPTATAYLCLTGLVLFQGLHYLGYQVPTITEFAWYSLLYLTPSRLISILDNRAGKSPAEGSSTRSGSWTYATKSKAMERVLGLNNGEGIMNKLQYTKKLPSIGSFFHATSGKGLSDKPPGLGNWDNSCYQNSVVQALSSLSSLSIFLDAALSITVEKSNSTREALREIIEKLNDPSNIGKLFWIPEQLKNMSTYQQQDAQEYFSKLVDEIEKEMLTIAKHKKSKTGLSNLGRLRIDPPYLPCKGKAEDKRSTNESFRARFSKLKQLPDELASVLLKNPLEGLLAQRVGCLQCGFVEGLSLIPFNCLTVPLGRQWMYDVRTCLDDYTTLEHIRGVECTKCTLLMNQKQLERLLRENHDRELTPLLTEAQRSLCRDKFAAVNEALHADDFSDHTLLKKCNIPSKTRVITTKTRQAVIARTPESLIIHINRSMFDESSGLQCKNFAEVRFPQRLDLAPWSLGSRTSNDVRSSKLESWSLDPSKSMLPSETEEPNSEAELIYDLHAIITHYGRHENGHYICYRKHRARSQTVGPLKAEETESWWRLSDEEVSEVSEETVLAQGGVFMLFYEKIQRPSTGKSFQPILAEPLGYSAKSLVSLYEASLEVPVGISTKPVTESPIESPPESPSGYLVGALVDTLAETPLETPGSEISKPCQLEPEFMTTAVEELATDMTTLTLDIARSCIEHGLETVNSQAGHLSLCTSIMKSQSKVIHLKNDLPEATKFASEPDSPMSKASSVTMPPTLSKRPSLTATQFHSTALRFHTSSPSSSSQRPLPQQLLTNQVSNISTESLNDGSISPKSDQAKPNMLTPPMRTSTPRGGRGSVSRVDQSLGSMVKAN